MANLNVAQLREPREDPEAAARLIAATDLLIDGPFLADQVDHERPWAGSRNQGFHVLSDRYVHLDGRWHESPDRVEIRVSPDGRVDLNGWADTDALESLLAGLDTRRAQVHRRLR